MEAKVYNWHQKNSKWLLSKIKGRKHLTTNTLQFHALLGKLNPNLKRPCPFAITIGLHPSTTPPQVPTCNPNHILYINCVVYLSRDNYVAGFAFSVYYCTWMINCQKVQFRMHPWRYLNARKEWTEFSRRVFADHWTQRKVTVRAPIDDRRMESFRRREKCTQQ